MTEIRQNVLFRLRYYYQHDGTTKKGRKEAGKISEEVGTVRNLRKEIQSLKKELDDT